jgi:hypothetical protein
LRFLRRGRTLESAEETYGEGGRARRAAYAALKHTHEKVGDHWEPKEAKGPSDPQAETGTPKSPKGSRPTAQGVNANASKGHLDEVAKKVGIEHPEKMNKGELVQAIEKANARQTRKSR